MDFYTHISRGWDKLFFRGVEEGKRVTRRINFAPTFYMPSPDGAFKTIHDQALVPKTFDNIEEAETFLKTFENVGNFDVYGNPRHQYAYITQNYPRDIKFDHSLIYEANIDIEVDSEDGFAEVNDADKPILSITIEKAGHYYVWGYAHPTGGTYKPHLDTVTFYEHKDERCMLRHFIDWWSHDYPDVITGWNISLYDTPMLLHRITNLFDEKTARMMSPFHKLESRNIIIMGREHRTYDIVGINSLDMLELFKKFSSRSSQESYRLDNIANVVLGERKLSYSEYRNLHNLYSKNYQKFIEYNIHDTTLVRGINNEEKLLELAYELAYDAKVNPGDVFSQIRMWTQIIDDFLWRENTVCSVKRKAGSKEAAYSGAYVKDPQSGLHQWIASFDAISLYPHLIMQWNISPDTIIQRSNLSEIVSQASVEGLLDRSVGLNSLKIHDLTMAPNGALFTRTKKGFAVRILDKMFVERDAYKKKMINADKELQKATDSAEKKKWASEKLKYKNLQMTKKICLNSYYGSCGNPWFHLYDVMLAEGVTTAGRLVIQWAERTINDYLNKILQTESVDYILASDTDSLYINLAPLIEKVCPDVSTKEKVDFLDKVCKQKLQPQFNSCFNDLAKYVNAFEQKMSMARESIVDKAIWTGKKHYILNIHNKEGVSYNPPQIEVKGLELVKSSTPMFCREKMKAALPIIMNQTEDDMIAFINSVKAEFQSLNPEDVSFPRGVNGLRKYSDRINIWGFKTPMHTKASLIYNHYLAKYGLDKKYELIKEGDKIRFTYVLQPNKLRTEVIAFPGSLPSEFEIDIDYDTQFEKSFLEPMRTILDAIGWHTEKQESILSILRKLRENVEANRITT